MTNVPCSVRVILDSSKSEMTRPMRYLDPAACGLPRLLPRLEWGSRFSRGLAGSGRGACESTRNFCPDLPQRVWRKLSHISVRSNRKCNCAAGKQVPRRLIKQQNRDDLLPKPAMEAVGYLWHSTCFELNGVFSARNHEMSKVPHRDATCSSQLPGV